MGVPVKVLSALRSESSDITGMRTPRRLDFLPLVANQLPTSSNTEQPPSSSEAAASTRQKRTARDLIILPAPADWDQPPDWERRHRRAPCHRMWRRHS